MSTEEQVFKGTKLISNTKNKRLKIYSRGWTLENTTLKIQNKIHNKNYKNNIYEIFFKIGPLFSKVIISYKNKN